MKNRTFLRVATVCLAVPAGALLAAGPALAAGDVVVTNTETIQAHLNATGKVKDARVYDQLAFTGNGTVDVANPVSSKGLRNLDGFGGYDVKDGKLVTTVKVDGDKRLRTVSDFDKKIPLTIAVTYLLNGKEVTPDKVVGASGDLEVRYRVENVTATSQQITFDDGTGQQVTKDAQVVIPMVGSLTTVLPSSFTDVSSEQANMAGDGRGGTKLSFTMTLFGPIGSATSEFGYTARIKDGQVPPATISALPVSPLESPSFKGGAESYKGGADTGVQLTAGATEIDANLLKLRDGAGQLLAGLIQLRDGADQLNDGLAGEAAPGAAKLAAGAGDAAVGADQLNDGLYKINAGGEQLAAGAGELSEGLNDGLAPGAQQLADGLQTLKSSLNDLPAAVGEDPDFQTLIGTMDLLIQGIGDTTSSDSDTVMGGLKQISAGLAQIDGGLPRLEGGLSNPSCSLADPENPANPCGIQQVAGLLQDQLNDPSTATSTAPVLANLAALKGELGAAAAKQAVDYLRSPAVLDCGKPSPLQALASVDPRLATATMCSKVTRSTNELGSAPPTVFTTTVEPELVDSVLLGIVDKIGDPAAPAPGTAMRAVLGIQAGIGDKTTVNTLLYGLNQIDRALGSATTPGATLQYGVAALRSSLYSDCSPEDADFPDNCGFSQVLQLVQAGVFSLVDSIAAGITGDPDFARLVAGGQDLAAGAEKAASGASRLSTGADQLAAGTGDAKAGAAQLADGNRQIADGASDLAGGLNDAAVGSGKLADGLTTAAESAPKLKDGAQQLSDEGTKKLVEAGKSTAADYGEKYALIVAGAERAKNEGMAYGAPEGAAGVTAYSLELAGMDGEGERNVGRGLGALVVLGLGTGAAALVRRRFI
jgi:putative membrane protein